MLLEQRGGKFNCRCVPHCTPSFGEGWVGPCRVGKGTLALCPPYEPQPSPHHPKAMNLKASPSRLIWPALKWPPITSVGVSAKRENSSRRVVADCLGSESPVDAQSRWAIWRGGGA